MKNLLKLLPITAMAAVLMAAPISPARAGLIDTVQNGLNEYEDISREHVFFNGNSFLSTGSVISGFSELTERTNPSPGVLMNNTLYAVFSLQVVQTGPSSLNFVPVTVPGQTLSALTGLAVNPNAVIAFIDKPQGSPFSQDYVTPTVPPSGIQAYLTAIAQNPGSTFEFSAGYASPSVNDFFSGNAFGLLSSVTAAALDSTPSSITLSAFFGGLSVLDNNTGLTFNNSVPGNDSQLHQLAILRGTTSGAANDPYYSDFGASGVQDNASFEINIGGVVPEPASVLSLSVGILCLAGIARRRKSAA